MSLAEKFATLTHNVRRYVAAWRAAWSQRESLDSRRRTRDEAAFLPAALAIQETAMSPLPRVTAALIVSLFVIAVAWSVIGKVNVVAIAHGRIAVSAGTKVVQPFEAGVVTAIHVRNGSHVKAGDVLIELDATTVAAAVARLEKELQTARRELWRVGALTNGGESAADELPTEQMALATAELAAEREDIEAKRRSLRAERLQLEAEEKTVQAAVDKLHAMLPMMQRRAEEYANLADAKFVSAHGSQDQQRQRIEMERELAVQTSRLVAARAASYRSDQSLSQYEADLRLQLSERASQARLKISQLDHEYIGARQSAKRQTLVAPVTGSVQQLAIHTEGGVVTPAQALMVIVPDDAEVTAEVVVENRDIGFVHPEQLAKIKLETFPYTRYGTVGALVSRVSADAVLDDQGNAMFPAIVELQRPTIMVDGKWVKLVPGMAITAEISTGKRRIIEYFLSPLQRQLTESLRER